MNWGSYISISLVKSLKTEKNYKITFFTLSSFRSFHLCSILQISKKQKLVNNILKTEISKNVNTDFIPILEKFFKAQKYRSVNYSFVVDDFVAGKIVKKILLDLNNKASNIIEYNPGLGLITLNLIKNNITKITIVNTHEIINLSLNNLISSYSNQVKFSVQNVYLDLFSKQEAFIGSVLQHAGSGEITNVIAVFTSYLIMSVFTYKSVPKEVWKNFHSVNFYLVIREAVLNKILLKKEHSKFTVYCLFHLLFTIEVLDEYPREAFLPPSPIYEEKMILVKIKKAPKYIGIPENCVQTFIVFLQILGRSRYNFIIPTLEQYIPDCGIYLISKGISMILQAQDLSASECVELFNLLTLHEGFKHFKSVCSNIYVHTDILDNLEENEEMENLK